METKNILYEHSLKYRKRRNITLLILAPIVISLLVFFTPGGVESPSMFSEIVDRCELNKLSGLYNIFDVCYTDAIFLGLTLLIPLILLGSLIFKGDWGITVSEKGITIHHFTGGLTEVVWDEVLAYQIFKPRVTWDTTYLLLQLKDGFITRCPLKVKDSQLISQIFESHNIKKNIK